MCLVGFDKGIDFFHGENSVDLSENKSLYIPEDSDHVHTLKPENALTATGNVTHMYAEPTRALTQYL